MATFVSFTYLRAVHLTRYVRPPPYVTIKHLEKPLNGLYVIAC